jgi:hypothetical protein
MTAHWGFPCCVHFPCVHAVATAPAQRLGFRFSLSPKGLSGRPAHRPIRDLLGVHSRYGLHTRAVTVYRDTLIGTSIAAPFAAGVVAGWDLHPLERCRIVTAHTHTGHRRPIFDVMHNTALIQRCGRVWPSA